MSDLPALAPLTSELATPQTIGVRQAMADAIIAVAIAAKEWPLLHQAVDIKIEDQRTYVSQWDSRVRPARNPEQFTITDRVTLSVAQLEAESGISPMQTSRWRKALANPEAYHDQIVLAACRKAGLEPEINRVTPNSGENEWFTPAAYIAAAREVMGGIDLDPATHPLAQETIQATQHYTAADNGLAQPWHGRVWLNPPYAQPLIGQFVDKLLAELANDVPTVTQAILLTNNCTDTAWFHAAANCAQRLCFTLGRIRFVDINGSPGESPLQGQTFFYFGRHLSRFEQVFDPFGFIR